jgi:hypothetical protein
VQDAHVPDALASLRESLEAQRRLGIGFDQAWSNAIAEVPNSGWRTRDTIESTRPAWQRAYLRQPPTPGERSLLRVARALAELERERLEREALAPVPGLPAPKDRRSRGTGNGHRRGRKPRLPGRKMWR